MPNTSKLVEIDHVREKLIELVATTDFCPVKGAVKTIGSQFSAAFIEAIADHLIANGVPAQRWISVTERLPEIGSKVLTLDKWGHIRDRELYRFDCGALVFRPDGLLPGKDVTHWMPLPSPPTEV